MSKIKETYTASDRRVYNGALCSDMQREANHTKYLENCMKKLDPTTACTYFPMEDKYLVFTNTNFMENPNLVGPPQELTGKFYSSKQEAMIEAIGILENRGSHADSF